MADKAAVIAALEHCMKDSGCHGCPYDGICKSTPFALEKDTLALLKVEPLRPRARGRVERFWACGECGAEIEKCAPFCRVCGREAKWDG